MDPRLAKVLAQLEKDNLIEAHGGHARVYAKLKARSLWPAADVPVYDRNFLVRFSFGGQSWLERAAAYPVVDGLTKDFRNWVGLKLLQAKVEMQRGGLAQLREAVVPQATVNLARTLEVYLANVSPTKRESALKNAQRLRHIGEEMTGRCADEILMTDSVWSKPALRGWVRMRQEYFRRGWSAENAQSMEAAVRAERWQELRAALASGALPGVDEDTEMEGNTTILSYLACAKAVFARQREYLEGLTLPPLEALRGFSVKLTVPSGHREIPAEVKGRILEGLPALREESVHEWLLCLLCFETGQRPVSVKRAGLGDLRVVESAAEAEALRAQTAADWRLPVEKVEAIGGVVRFRPTKRGTWVNKAISAELTAALQAHGTAESLIGARSATHAKKIHDGLNAWLRAMGLTGTHGVYMLRHHELQNLRDAGEELAMAGGGHRTKQAMERYSSERRVVPRLKSVG